MQAPTVGVVVPAIQNGGGLASLAGFLCRAMARSGRYRARVVSVATSAADDSSVRLASPRTWLKGCRLEYGEWDDLPYVHVGAYLSEVEACRYWPRRRLTACLEACDLVQVVGGSPAWALVAIKARRPVALLAASLVALERSSALQGTPTPRKVWRRTMTRLTSRLERRALALADLVLVLNQSLATRLAECVEPRRLKCTPVGVDIHRFRPRVASDICSATSKHAPYGYVLSVARWDDPRKNVPLLLQAYARLLRRWPDAPDLLLAGATPPPSGAWRQAERSGIADRIRFVGPLGTDELAALYRHASLLVLPSDEEGLGIVLLEAMASGLPVVSTDSGGPRAVVVEGETGLLCSVGDAEALAAAMMRLLADQKLRHRMGERARQHVIEHFSEVRAGALILEAYDELLERSAQSPHPVGVTSCAESRA